jgi:sigma-B regulation protein RsbU (phosphoserine phosphatase)
MTVSTSDGPGAVPPRARIWAVDDSALQGEICRLALEPFYEVRLFNHGARLLEALATSHEPPDVLVVDWHMPELSGLDVCRFVRETRDSGTLPVLVLTASGVENLAEAFEAGANDFVRKPFSVIELVARIKGLARGKLIHDRLAEAERRLRVEGEYRERFIGMLAHDLRQPLNTVALANQALVQSTASGPAAPPLLIVQNQAAKRMSRMISELLDFTRSRPETGMPLERRFLDLETVAREVIEEMRIGHPDRSFELNVTGSCEGSWDRDRLAQICSNLITNAIEHSSSPTTAIAVNVTRQSDHVELSVSNQGTPIPESLLPLIFEPFRRGTGASRASSGVGLGLHIVYEIARAHGGTVAAQSDASATVFRVALPTDPQPASRRV